MRHTSLVLACCCSLALVQGNSSSPTSQLDVLHARALAALRAEQDRAKQPLCPKAVTTLEINECDSREVRLTEANYLTLVRALGALLRSATDASAPRTAPLPFDVAEAAWHTYRKEACNAAGSQYEGGSMRPSVEMGCTLTVTRHHMDELWQLYSTVGTQ